MLRPTLRIVKAAITSCWYSMKLSPVPVPWKPLLGEPARQRRDHCSASVDGHDLTVYQHANGFRGRRCLCPGMLLGPLLARCIRFAGRRYPAAHKGHGRDVQDAGL